MTASVTKQKELRDHTKIISIVLPKSNHEE